MAGRKRMGSMGKTGDLDLIAPNSGRTLPGATGVSNRGQTVGLGDKDGGGMDSLPTPHEVAELSTLILLDTGTVGAIGLRGLF